MLRRDGTLSTPMRIALAMPVIAGLVIAAISDPFTTFFFLSYVLVGGLLVIKRPHNLVSWLLVAIAFTFLGTTSRPALDVAGLQHGTASVTDEVWTWINTWSGGLTFLLLAILAATFPAGHLPGGRWRPVLLVAFGAAACVVVSSMFGPTLTASTNGVNSIDVPNPFALLPPIPHYSDAVLAGFVLTIAVFALAIGNMLARYRAATDTTRLQLRWLLAAITFVCLAVTVGVLLGTLFGDQADGSIWIPAIIAYPTVPIAIGVAVLRYRLYEIDRIVNRALVYGTVTAILAGVFAAVTLLTQRIFVTLTGQKSDVAIVLTTLAVATLYTPVRRRVERLVDRYFKYDQRLFGAYRDELQRTLDVLSPAPAANRLAREAIMETGAVAAAVVGSDGGIVASAGSWPAEPATTVPVAAEGAPLVAVILGPRRDGRPHRPQAVAALGEVAALAAMASAAIPAGVVSEV